MLIMSPTGSSCENGNDGGGPDLVAAVRRKGDELRKLEAQVASAKRLAQEIQQPSVSSQVLALFGDLVDSLVLDVAMEFHRATCLGLDSRLNQQDDEGAMPSSSVREGDMACQPRHTGVDVFGQSHPSVAMEQVACLNCGRHVVAGKFAPHLEKCMGKGRNASRAAARALTGQRRPRASPGPSGGTAPPPTSLAVNVGLGAAAYLDSEPSEDEPSDDETKDSSYGPRKRPSKLKSSKPPLSRRGPKRVAPSSSGPLATDTGTAIPGAAPVGDSDVDCDGRKRRKARSMPLSRLQGVDRASGSGQSKAWLPGRRAAVNGEESIGPGPPAGAVPGLPDNQVLQSQCGAALPSGGVCRKPPSCPVHSPGERKRTRQHHAEEPAVVPAASRPSGQSRWGQQGGRVAGLSSGHVSRPSRSGQSGVQEVAEVPHSDEVEVKPSREEAEANRGVEDSPWEDPGQDGWVETEDDLLVTGNLPFLPGY